MANRQQCVRSAQQQRKSSGRKRASELDIDLGVTYGNKRYIENVLIGRIPNKSRESVGLSEH
jgi:hypothetical protein